MNIQDFIMLHRQAVHYRKLMGCFFMRFPIVYLNHDRAQVTETCEAKQWIRDDSNTNSIDNANSPSSLD